MYYRLFLIAIFLHSAAIIAMDKICFFADDGLLTWVRNPDYVKIVRELINQEQREDRLMIENNKDDHRFFGINFEPQPEAQGPFLKYVSDLSKKNEPTIMEIAAGRGSLVWKILFALEGRGNLIVNELSEMMIDIAKKKIEKLPISNNNVHWIAGDCFNELPKSNFKGKIDVLYVGNMEHYLTPSQHQDFLWLVYDLLAPGSRGYFIARTFEDEGQRPKGYWDGDETYNIYDHFSELGNTNVDHFNFFTIDIYMKAWENLKVNIKFIDKFYIGKNGQRIDQWTEYLVEFVCVVVEKPGK